MTSSGLPSTLEAAQEEVAGESTVMAFLLGARTTLLFNVPAYAALFSIERIHPASSVANRGSRKNAVARVGIPCAPAGR